MSKVTEWRASVNTKEAHVCVCVCVCVKLQLQIRHLKILHVCKVPKHVAVLYVINSIHMSTII